MKPHDKICMSIAGATLYISAILLRIDGMRGVPYWVSLVFSLGLLIALFSLKDEVKG